MWWLGRPGEADVDQSESEGATGEGGYSELYYPVEADGEFDPWAGEPNFSAAARAAPMFCAGESASVDQPNQR
eukprot:7024263-Pyramimonas_sp.AAC.1